jgi:hypothetical protein
MRRENRIPGRTICALILALLCVGCDDPEQSGEIGEGSGSGEGSGEGSGSAPCWVASRSGLCPEQPRGSSPEDCPSGSIFEGSGFAPGTGPCKPHLPDWNCPAGWTAVPALTDGSGAENPPEGLPQFNRCEPPPLPADCPAGTFARVGSAACQPLGTACPAAADRWPDEATLRALAPSYTGPIVYAAADGAVDGAGTRQSPRLLGAAAIRAAQTGLVALALGTYNTPVRLDRSVALVGACVTGTTLTADQPSDNAGVVDLSSGAPALLANLSITGERPGVWIRGTLDEPHLLSDLELRDTRQHAIVGNAPQAVELRRIRVAGVRPRASDGFAARGMEFTAGAQVTLSELDLSGADLVGLLVADAGTTLTADRLYLHDMAPNPRSTGGSALAVVNEAVATAQQVIIARAAGSALYLDAGTLTSTDLLIEDTQPQVLNDAFGVGISMTVGAVASLRRAIVRRNFRAGISIGTDGDLTLSDAVIDDTQPQRSDGDFGDGLIAFDGARASVSQAIFRRNHQGGVRVSEVGSRVEITDALIEETAPRPSDNRLGFGLEAFDAGTGAIRRAYLRGNHEAAILVAGLGANLQASDLSIVETRPPNAGLQVGVGIGVREGGVMTGERLHLARNTTAGLYVRDPGSTFQGTDLVITPGPYAPDTVGLLSSDGASVTLDRATLSGIDNLGILTTGAGSALALTNLLIEDTAPDLASSLNGRAIEVTRGARLSLATALLKDNHDLGILAIDPNTSITATDLAIEGTRRRVAPLNDFGTALGLYDEARFTGANISLLDNAQCGLQVAGDGAFFDIEGATISGNAVGLSFQITGDGAAFVREHLRGEQFSENAEDVIFDNLPVPDPSGALP